MNIGKRICMLLITFSLFFLQLQCPQVSYGLNMERGINIKNEVVYINLFSLNFIQCLATAFGHRERVS